LKFSTPEIAKLQSVGDLADLLRARAA